MRHLLQGAAVIVGPEGSRRLEAEDLAVITPHVEQASAVAARLALGVTRAMVIGERGKRAIVFGQQLDAMIEALKVLGEPEKAIPTRVA